MRKIYVANVFEGVVLVGSDLDNLLEALVKVNPTISPTEADLVVHTIEMGGDNDSSD